ncbi:hypothetical protein DKX38_024381 [Salix brachista]|uniref:Uncharacterized protein n=1 Tax=Salix brachista TaxID=2182728 RepID=A0A5N5JM32_9ROSI|nr:hypothetical protein DKX38_024381 [Salix brachista]
MGDSSGKIDVEKLISFSDDLIDVLKDQRDINNLTNCLQQSHSLKSSCDAEFNDSKTLIEGTGSGASKRSCSYGGAPIMINNEISDLECQRVSFEERKRHVKKDEKDELRAQRMLSMYASVTNIIPDLDDHSKISGHIVHRDNKAVEKFEFDPTKISSFEICGGLLLLNVFGFRPFRCDGALVRHCILVFVCSLLLKQ